MEPWTPTDPSQCVLLQGTAMETEVNVLWSQLVLRVNEMLVRAWKDTNPQTPTNVSVHTQDFTNQVPNL